MGTRQMKGGRKEVGGGGREREREMVDGGRRINGDSAQGLVNAV